MSKAFTKDDGPDPPQIQRHRAPLPAGTPNYVTAAGLRALREELLRLDASTSEPGARGAAWKLELEERIATAIVAPPPADQTTLRFGARVTLRSATGDTRSVQLVGVDEADPGAGRIAFVAPLARALLGHRIGDVVTVRAPGGDEELEIVRVTYDPRER